jgi:hypothetical protein
MDLGQKIFIIWQKAEIIPNLLDVALMRRGVDSFSLSSWEPQEEGMMSTAAIFSLSKKPRFNRPGKSQYSRR